MSIGIKRGLVVALGFIAQILLTVFIYFELSNYIYVIEIAYRIIGVLIVLALIKNSKSYSYTIPWIIIILVAPVMGTILYIIIGQNKRRSKTYQRLRQSEEKNKHYLNHNDSFPSGTLHYISHHAGFPVTSNNDVRYFPLGDSAFPEMLEDLRHAQNFIFLEYFIIASGYMWDTILQILREKVNEGVEVRVMYDDVGCLSTLPSNYKETLEKYGIKCIVFNKINPLSGIIMNNRDHRKILVIDGIIGYTGGINLADEYINLHSRFGHWKDNAIRIQGEGVWNLTVLFLTMWNAYREDDTDFTIYKYPYHPLFHNGYLAGYGDTPLDDEETAEDIYITMINSAKNYLYIFTPYLIIDVDMTEALVLASKRGVDVRIVIPKIPDKKIVYTLSESYIEPLMSEGIKIYKYTPGFIHSKVFVSDDTKATVGTVNLDFRSLYLHYECGVYLEDVECIKDIKQDALQTISQSESLKHYKQSWIKDLWQSLLRIIAPLL